MGRLVSKGVPDLRWRPVRTTDHHGVASRVLGALQTSPGAISLNNGHTCPRESVAQNAMASNDAARTVVVESGTKQMMEIKCHQRRVKGRFKCPE